MRKLTSSKRIIIQRFSCDWWSSTRSIQNWILICFGTSIYWIFFWFCGNLQRRCLWCRIDALRALYIIEILINSNYARWWWIHITISRFQICTFINRFVYIIVISRWNPFYTVLIQCAESDASKRLRLRHNLKFKTVSELLLVRPMADCFWNGLVFAPFE